MGITIIVRQRGMKYRSALNRIKLLEGPKNQASREIFLCGSMLPMHKTEPIIATNTSYYAQ